VRDVEFAGPMAPLASDGVPPEDRRPIPVDRTRYRLNPVRVAEQAMGRDRPVEVADRGLIAGGLIPLSPLRVPSNRRLEEEAIAFDQVGDPLPPGTDREPDLRLVLGDDAARGIPSRLFMDDMTVGILDGVLEPLCLEQGSVARFVAPQGRHRDRKQRATRRVLAEGLRDLRMAADAGCITDIFHSQARVHVGRAGVRKAYLRSTPPGDQGRRGSPDRQGDESEQDPPSSRRSLLQ
jgi:hypothetical protein